VTPDGLKNLHGKDLEALSQGHARTLSPIATFFQFKPEKELAMANLSIIYRKISELKPYPRNARTHSRKQVKQIAAAIGEFGFTNSVLIDESDQIIAGHGRVQAAKLLELVEVPTVQIAHLSATQKRAYILADNRLAEKAGWDQEILAVELQGLLADGFEVVLTGFEAPDIDVVLDDAANKKSDQHGDDNIPAAGPAVTQAGDLWLLGTHRIFCGDALDGVSYNILLDGSKASLIFTDPPYNVAIDGNVANIGGRSQIQYRSFAMGCGEMTSPAFTSFLTTTYQHLVANSLDGSIHYICMDWRHMQEMLAAGYGVYSELKNVCIWNKSNGGMGSFYRSKHEHIYVWKSGTAAHVNNFELGQHGRYRTNVWDYAGVNTFGSNRMDELQMHPTVKPVALVADAIKDCSKQGDLVLDPFCGSGTIIVAAERTGRKARALEIDPAYVDVAIRRWEKLTGKSATLSTGGTFEEITEQRTVEPNIPQTAEAVAPQVGGNHVGAP
jgi:DNA modification methylase